MNKSKALVAVAAILAIAAIALGSLYFSNNSAKTKEIADRDAEIADRDAEIAARDRQIELLNAEITDKAGQIETLTADAAYQKGQVDLLAADVKGKADEIGALEIEVRRLENEARENVSAMDDLRNQAVSLNSEKEALQEDLRAKEAQIAELKAQGGFTYDLNAFSCYGYVEPESVNFRSEPSIVSERLGRLQKNTLCVVLGVAETDGGDWYHVIYDGKTGYVKGDYLRHMTVEELGLFLRPDPDPQENPEDLQPLTVSAGPDENMRADARKLIQVAEEYLPTIEDKPAQHRAVSASVETLKSLLEDSAADREAFLRAMTEVTMTMAGIYPEDPGGPAADRP